MGLGRMTTLALWITIALCLCALVLHLNAAGYKAMSRDSMVLVLPVFAALMGHRGRRFPRLALMVSIAAVLLAAGGLFAILSKTAA